MPVEAEFWKVNDDKAERIEFSVFPSEKRLESILAEDISILDPSLMLIGRQVVTSYKKIIDMLAIKADGTLVVIELKRDMTPRDSVAQILDYGSWIKNLSSIDIADIFEEYVHKWQPKLEKSSLNQVFCRQFGFNSMPDSINENHELVIVSSGLDNSSERIIHYLYENYGVAINAVFFRFIQDDEREYLSRVWLQDPTETEKNAPQRQIEESWNGEYYVSFGENEDRHWEDARKHGYISAGFGEWYSRTLNLLEVGSRIWVNSPGYGYVGVGKVIGEVEPITEFKVKDEKGRMVRISKVVKNGPNPSVSKAKLEYYVRVKWIKTVPLDKAVREIGFFGNQNTVAKPITKKWTHTVDRLKEIWGIS